MPGVPPHYPGRSGDRLHRSPPLKLENRSVFFSGSNLIQVFFLHADLSHTGVYDLPVPSELLESWLCREFFRGGGAFFFPYKEPHPN